MGAGFVAGSGTAQADSGQSAGNAAASPGPRTARVPGAKSPAVGSTRATKPVLVKPSPGFIPGADYDPNRNVQDGSIVSGRLELDAPGAFALTTPGPGLVSPGASPRWLRGPRINAEPARGLVSINADGTFSYTADPELSRTGGLDTFTVSVSDSLGRSTFVPVTVEVISTSPTGGYTAAVTQTQSDGSVGGAVVGGDGRHNVSYSIETGPEKGTVELDAATGRFSYAPSLVARHRAAATGAAAADSADLFTIKVSGGRGGPYLIPVTVALDPFNTAPEVVVASATPDAVTGSVTAVITGRDGDSDRLSYTVTSGPAFGSVTSAVAGPLPDGGIAYFTYVPTEAARRASARGGPSKDTFTVTADDGHGGLADAVVAVAIEPGNAAPVASFVSGDPDAAAAVVTGSVIATDADGDVLTYGLTGGPGGGTVSVNAVTGAFVYTPTAAARHAAAAGAATDRFTVRVTDGFGGVVDVPVAVAIGAVNTIPVASYAAGNPTGISGVVTGSVNATDADGDIVGFAVIDGPVHGAVSLNAATGAFAYTPTAVARHAAARGGAGRDGFTVRVSDGYGGSTDVPVTVVIAPANADPTGSFTAGNPDLSSGAVIGAVLGADADGDLLTYALTGGPVSGAVLLNSATGAFTYTPTPVARHAAAAGGATADGFTVRISDGHGGAVDVPVAVAVGAANTVPVAAFTAGDPDAVSGLVNGSVTATDADGDTVLFAVASGPASGSVSLNSVTGAFVYTPTAVARQGAAGAGPRTDSFTVAVTDGHGGSANQMVSVAIAPVLGCVGCAFVASTGANTVSAIDTDTNTVVATIPVGVSPFGVVVNPAGTRVYVSNDGTNTVSVIDAVANTLVTTVTVGANARGIAITPDGAFVYVTNRGANSVSVIKTATNTVIATISVGSWPNWVAVSPDGTSVYVINYFSNNVSVIDVATNRVTTTISVGGTPFGVAFNPTGTRAYVANQGGGVSVIDTVAKTTIATIPVGSGPYAVAFNPSGTRAYVTNHFDGSVSVINTATNAVIATVAVGSNPAGVGVSPDGTRLYVAVGGNPSSMKIIDTVTNTVLSSFTIANGPSYLALSPL